MSANLSTEDIDNILKIFKRRKVFWELMIGTVQATPDLNSSPVVSVLLDGDKTPINAQMIAFGGSVISGSRVYVAFVPPSGYFIVGTSASGQQDSPSSDFVYGLQFPQGGSGNPITGGAISVDTIIATIPDNTYFEDIAYMCSIHFTASFSVSTGGVRFTLRAGLTLSDPTVLVWTWRANQTGLDDFANWGVFTGQPSGYTGPLSISASPTSGTVSLFATGAGQSQMMIQAVGRAANWDAGGTILPTA